MSLLCPFSVGELSHAHLFRPNQDRASLHVCAHQPEVSSVFFCFFLPAPTNGETKPHEASILVKSADTRTDSEVGTTFASMLSNVLIVLLLGGCAYLNTTHQHFQAEDTI